MSYNILTGAIEQASNGEESLCTLNQGPLLYPGDATEMSARPEHTKQGSSTRADLEALAFRLPVCISCFLFEAGH